MSYAILRFEKNKGGKAGAAQAHNERQKESYKSNPDIDQSRSQNNYHLIQPTKSYRMEVEDRIRQAGCRVRKDSVKFVEALITTSHDFMASLPAEQQQQYFHHALEFLAQNVQKENIFSAVVHMDEKTPHMHVCFVPLTQDGRLSAKELLGNRTKLMQWQDKFYDHMVKAFPTLERGQPAVQTGRDHIPQWMYKKATKLTKGMERVKQAIQDIGKFKTGQKKEEAIKVLSDWFSEAQNFISHADSLNLYEQNLQRQQREAARSVQDARIRIRELEDEKMNMRLENSHLLKMIRQQERLLNKVSPEVMEQIQRKGRNRGLDR